MTDDNRPDQGSAATERFLGVATIVLFAFLLVASTIRLIIGWDAPLWSTAWTVIGAAFGVSLFAYLADGGADTVLHQKSADADHRLTAAAKVGRIGIGFLALAILGNLVAAVWEGGKPVAWEIARDIAGGCFGLCFVVYLGLWYSGRSRAS